MVTDALVGQPAVTAQPLQRVHTRGWRRGLATFLAKEHHAWWGTRRWLVDLLVWLALINGAVALTAWAVADARNQPEAAAEITPGRVYQLALQVFFQIGVMATAIGAVIGSQGAIIREKQLGTAAWVLSKPTSRSAFVLAKVSAYATALLVLGIALPSLVGYAEIWLVAGRAPDLAAFVAGVGVWSLHLLFYLALTMMLGTLFASRGPVVGLGLGFLFAGNFIPTVIPGTTLIFPWPLSQLSLVLALGADASQPIPATAIVPVLATILWTGVFVTVALWRFRREEF